MKIEVDFEDFIGFEPVGIAIPKPGDYYTCTVGHIPTLCNSDNLTCLYAIYRKVENWRKATPQEIFEKMIDDKRHRMRVPKAADFVPVSAITSMDCNTARVLTTYRLVSYYVFSEIQILEESK
jgi:hypothetical protein